MDNIAILILAAGKSSRMGRVKQLLKINSKTILENAIENAQNSKASSVFCVLGANYKLIKNSLINTKIEIIFNPNFENGISSSIVSGIKHIENQTINYNSVLIMLADQPEVNSNYLNQLIKKHATNPQQIIASNYKDKAGVPAIFSKNYFNQLLQLSGDKGAKEFLNKQSGIVKIEQESPLIDLDTYTEYQNFIKN